MKKFRYEQAALQNVVEHFHIYGEFIETHLIGPGNINQTFLLIMDQAGNHVRYVLQRINAEVFRRPGELMNNYVRITEHLYRKYKAQNALDISRRCIQLIHTRHDCPNQALKAYWIDPQGGYWRCYPMIERVLSLEKVTHSKHAQAAAAAFARFQKDLCDLEGGLDLHPSIPRFHDILLRYSQLEEAVAADTAQRKASCLKEIQFYQQRKTLYSTIEKLRAQGRLPTRLCHNDTKINNILIDEHSGEGIAVIDLDTVMPGSILYDFGDLGRTSLSNSTEDETDTTRIFARMEYFKAMIRGFLGEWQDSLSEIEVRQLAFAPRFMTLIIGMRFLTDYLNGDVYFQTHSAQHNLERTRSHMALIDSMESREPDMQQIVKEVIAELNLPYSLQF